MTQKNSRNLSDRSNEPPKFAGIKTFMNLPYTSEVSHLEEYDFAILGLPFDTAATYRVGARFAPAAIRDISGSIRDYNPFLQVAPTETMRGVDFGDASVIPGNTDRSLKRMQKSTDKIVNHDTIPVCMGGDHLVSLPVLRSLAQKHGPLSLIHFDSHPDTWPDIYGEKYNHGTPFKRAAEENLIVPDKSIQIGLRGTFRKAGDFEANQDMGFDVITANQLTQLTPDEIGDRLKEKVGDNPVYLTFDIDFLDPAFAPGTGTPEIGGPSSARALQILRTLKLHNLKGFDLVEVLPEYDHSGITSLAAACIIFEILSLIAVHQYQ